MEETQRQLLAVKILSLAQWQKIYAIDTFVLPRLQYKMGFSDCTIEHYEKLDAKLRRVVRNICALPKRALVEYVLV